MIVIRNSSVTPEAIPALPGNVTVSAMIESDADIGADIVATNTTIITTGFIFTSTGTQSVLLDTVALAPTLFQGTRVLSVDRGRPEAVCLDRRRGRDPDAG